MTPGKITMPLHRFVRTLRALLPFTKNDIDSPLSYVCVRYAGEGRVAMQASNGTAAVQWRGAFGELGAPPLREDTFAKPQWSFCIPLGTPADVLALEELEEIVEIYGADPSAAFTLDGKGVVTITADGYEPIVANFTGSRAPRPALTANYHWLSFDADYAVAGGVVHGVVVADAVHALRMSAAHPENAYIAARPMATGMALYMYEMTQPEHVPTWTARACLAGQNIVR